eukprot:4720181-Pleurochrysis_carterae.AAC.2
MWRAQRDCMQALQRRISPRTGAGEASEPRVRRCKLAAGATRDACDGANSLHVQPKMRATVHMQPKPWNAPACRCSACPMLALSHPVESL